MRRGLEVVVAAMAAALGFAATPASAQTLKVGSAAPALKPMEWLKGEPVERFEPDRFYMVEFWATWCGPCIAQIPHLSKLQDTYEHKGLVVLAVAASERKEPSHIRSWMSSNSQRMRYRVAFDEKRAMSEDWMRAAGRNSIPSAFIVDYDGKIAFIGHPSQADQVVLRLAGEHADRVKAAAQKRESEAEAAEGTGSLGPAKQAKADALVSRINAAVAQSDRPRAIADIEKLVEMDPKQFAPWSVRKLALLVEHEGLTVRGASYARALVDRLVADRPLLLAETGEILLDARERALSLPRTGDPEVEPGAPPAPRPAEARYAPDALQFALKASASATAAEPTDARVRALEARVLWTQEKRSEAITLLAEAAESLKNAAVPEESELAARARARAVERLERRVARWRELAEAPATPAAPVEPKPPGDR